MSRDLILWCVFINEYPQFDCIGYRRKDAINKYMKQNAPFLTWKQVQKQGVTVCKVTINPV